MMTYGTKSDERKKLKGEVFTPPSIVFEMVMNLNECLPDISKTFFDPCIGEGQFPCAELVLKMFYSVDKLNEENALAILSSIFGMDIQADNVDKSRVHMLATFRDAYEFFTGEEISETALNKATMIIAQNLKTGNSLEFMQNLNRKNTEKQMKLFTQITE